MAGRRQAARAVEAEVPPASGSSVTMRKSRPGRARSMTAERPAFTTRQAFRRHRRRPSFARNSSTCRVRVLARNLQAPAVPKSPLPRNSGLAAAATRCSCRNRSKSAEALRLGWLELLVSESRGRRTSGFRGFDSRAVDCSSSFFAAVGVSSMRASSRPPRLSLARKSRRVA